MTMALILTVRSSYTSGVVMIDLVNNKCHEVFKEEEEFRMTWLTTSRNYSQNACGAY